MVENTNFGKACSFSEINPVEWDEEGGRYGWWKRREVGETSSERIESVSEVSIIIRSKADYCRDYPVVYMELNKSFEQRVRKRDEENAGRHWFKREGGRDRDERETR